MSSDIFFEIGIVIIIAALGGFIFRLIKQPLLPLYIFIGLLIGPILKLIPSSVSITHLSEIGIALLLFIIGLEIELSKLKKTSGVISSGIWVGLIQSVFTFFVGFLIARSCGLDKIPSIYIGLAASFSSTMVAIKMLSDKRELGTIWGRISIIILLVQDILALLALIFLSTHESPALTGFLFIFFKGVLLILVGILFGKYLFPRLFKFAAKSEELLFISAIAVCFAFALFSKYLGLTYAIGAFIAGLSLANLDFSYQIVSNIKPIRDFFAILFFVSLGIMTSLEAVSKFPLLILLLTAIVVVIKPISIFILLSLFRFKKDVSLNASVSLSQISEFSIIIVGVGLALSQIDNTIFSIISIVLFISVVISVYLFYFHRFINQKFARVLKLFERKNSIRFENKPKELKDHVVVFGYHRTGEQIVETLEKLGKKILIVDFDPDVIEEIKEKNYSYLYGDIGDIEILEKAATHNASLVVSTIPNTEDNLLILKETGAKSRKSLTYVAASDVEGALMLYRAGADYVIMPQFLGGEHVALLLKKFEGNNAKFKAEKKKQIKKLKELKNRHGFY